MLKKLLKIAPQAGDDGAFIPSPIALKLATSPTSNFDNSTYPPPYPEGKQKILMVCTEEKDLVMSNGKKFSTGNHPVEMLVPMLHFKNAGFEVDIFTPTGKSAKIEMWAMPKKDEQVKNIFSNYREKFENPKSLEDFVKNEMQGNSEFAAIFFPGGHGALLGLPENVNVKKLIQWAYLKDLLVLSICHGPAALLAASKGENKEAFIYKGYTIAAFPDSVDKQTPLIGYMPGHLTWKFGESLKNLGVKIINKKADKSVYKDRNLITGASPYAANDFGKLAVNELRKKAHHK